MYQEKDKYRLLIENLPDGLVYCKMVQDNTGKPVDYIFLEVNPSFKTLSGHPRDHIIGKKLTELYPGIKGLGFDWIGVSDQVAATGQSIRFQQYFDLSERWYDVTAYSDQPGYFTAVFHDITEHKQAEEALHTSEARYRLLVENAKEAILVAQDGMLKFVNRMTVDLMGYSEQELTSRPFPEFIHPDDRGMVVERHLKRLKGNVSQPRYAFRLVTRDGNIKWVEIGAVLIDWEGRPATLNFLTDITERKQAEESLQESNEIFKQFMENSPNYVFFKNDKIQAIRLSSNYEKMLGKPMHELLGKTMDDLFPSDLAKSMIADDLRVLNEGKQITVEEELNGRFYTTIKFPILVKGKPRYLAGYTMDITERKQAEEKNNWLASFPTLNPTPVLEIDQKKGIIFINTSAKKLFPDLENKQIDHPFVAGTIKYFTELNSSTVTQDDREIEVNGHWYLQTFFLVSPNQLRIYASDITERKKMEERERYFKQVLLAIRKVNQLIVQEIDPERLIDQACQILTETLGYYNALIALLDEGGKVTSTAAYGFDDGFTIFEEHLKQGKYPLCIKKAFHEKGTIVIDSVLDSCPDCPLYSGHVGRTGLSGRIQHGDKLYGMLSVSIPREYANLKETLKLFIELAGDLGLAFYKIDLEKEHKHMEMELIHSERMAIAGQLAAGVAHEFNNLLSIIGGSAEYAKGIRNDNEIKKSLDVIVKSVNRGAQVVKKLLTFTKRIELKKESVDLIEVIEEVVGLVKRDLENNLITVVRNYSDIPKTLIDVGQMQQVFLNLIINAKNAMSKGGKLAIKVEKEGKFIKIQFHNTGKTINKEDLPRLFTPFFATSLRQKKGMPGTGLGLAVSYGIIKAHNGVIKAESVKGKGTTFTILFSVTENENMAEVLPKAVAKAGKNNKRKLKQAEILIVDDEVEIRQLFGKVLDREGYSVTVADSGGNALNLCRKTKFDLIYLDIIMPGMDGISAFKKIKEISPKTKIVFFTGKLIEDKVAGMCLDEGAAGFLRKPIPLKDLVSYTQNILKDKNE